MKVVLIFILGIFTIVYSGSIQNSSDPIVAKYNVGYQIFWNKLYKLVSKSIRGDLIVCPLSAYYALALIHAGAKGPTETEIRQLMSYNLNSTESRRMWVYLSKRFNQEGDTYKILLANGIFIDNDFQVREPYKAIVENHLRSKCQSLDFANTGQTVNYINRWVKERTRKIDRLLDVSQVSGATKLLLVNTVYIAAKWQTTFNEEKTKPGIFYTSPTAKKSVNYMHCSRTSSYGYDVHLGAKFLELPLEGVIESLVIVLPDKKDGLAALEAKLEEVLAYNETEQEHVEISLPRFEFETVTHLKPVLQKLGARMMFDKKLADLSDISDTKGLFVNNVVQKTFISVNEAGIDAGAATAVLEATKKLTRPGDVTFNADHPFLFYVKVYSGPALFIGRVVNPRDIEENNDNDDEDEQ